MHGLKIISSIDHSTVYPSGLIIALRHSARRAANQTWISPSSSIRSSPVVSFTPSFSHIRTVVSILTTPTQGRLDSSPSAEPGQCSVGSTPGDGHGDA